MSLFSIKPESVNPAVDMLDRMPTPARKWNFDAEFIVPGVDSETQKFHFFVRSIDKPQYEFQYAEINEYGFKHKILTGITTGDLGIEFLDDTTNRVLNFINHYLINSVPEANLRYSQLNFLSVMQKRGFDTAGIETRAGIGNTIIKQIKINQYAGLNSDGTGRGRIRTWVFEEPQIVQFDLDKNATEEDALSGFVVRFNYKNVVIDLAGGLYPDRSDSVLSGLIDVATAFTPADAVLPRIGLIAAKRENPFAIGRLGNSIFSEVPGNQTIRTGAGLFNTVNDALGPQDIKGPTQLGRNDNISGQTTSTNAGVVIAAVPNTVDQASKLLKL